ncbi:MAG: hypothetical protein AAF620_01295 [Bacteroidota bacterium]
MKNFTIAFTQSEVAQLKECLQRLRKMIDHEYQYDKENKPIDDGVFRSACELLYKLDKTTDPDLDISLDEYLDYGRS